MAQPERPTGRSIRMPRSSPGSLGGGGSGSKMFSDSGSSSCMSRLRRGGGAGEIELCGRLARDFHAGREEERVGEAFGQLDVDVERVAGADHLLKFDVI